RDHLETGHVHEHGMQTLGMLRALPPGFADHATHHERHLYLPTVHVVAFGRDIDELVHAQHEEVHADMHMDWSHAGHRSADRDAGHGVLRERRTENALGAELLHQAAGRTLDRLVVVGIETEQKDARVAPHLLRDRFPERIDVCQDTWVTCR